MQLLLEAYCYAEETNRDLWDFAVEIEDLESAGVNKTDLRWLGSSEYVEAAQEVTPKHATKRRFDRAEKIRLGKTTCFIPTTRGINFAHQLRYSELLQVNRRFRRTQRQFAERLRQAEAIIEVQKRICEMLGIHTEGLQHGGDSDYESAGDDGR